MKLIALASKYSMNLLTFLHCSQDCDVTDQMSGSRVPLRFFLSEIRKSEGKKSPEELAARAVADYRLYEAVMSGHIRYQAKEEQVTASKEELKVYSAERLAKRYYWLSYDEVMRFHHCLHRLHFLRDARDFSPKREFTGTAR